MQERRPHFILSEFIRSIDDLSLVEQVREMRQKKADIDNDLIVMADTLSRRELDAEHGAEMPADWLRRHTTAMRTYEHHSDRLAYCIEETVRVMREHAAVRFMDAARTVLDAETYRKIEELV